MPVAKAILKPNMAAPLSLRLLAPDPCLLRRLLDQEKDERYRYLIKHGQVYGVDAETSTIYVELPQIPNILIVYRRPSERMANSQKMNLENRNL